jgi:hypothetical protein
MLSWLNATSPWPLSSVEIPSLVLSEHEGRHDLYDPLDLFPSLFRTFAGISTTEHVLLFANTYGFIEGGPKAFSVLRTTAASSQNSIGARMSQYFATWMRRNGCDQS